jgi:hypothetical protein
MKDDDSLDLGNKRAKEVAANPLQQYSVKVGV